MKHAIILTTLLTLLSACDDDKESQECITLTVEPFCGCVGCNNTCGPNFSKDRCSYEAPEERCIVTTGEGQPIPSIWRSTDENGGIIRVATTYDSMEGWENISAHDDITFCVEYDYLSDDYCAAWDGDYEGCIAEGCATIPVEEQICEGGTCTWEPSSICSYEAYGECGIEHNETQICKDGDDRVLRINDESIPSGWTLCTEE